MSNKSFVTSVAKKHFDALANEKARPVKLLTGLINPGDDRIEIRRSLGEGELA